MSDLDAALLLLDTEIRKMTNPVDVGTVLTAVGSFVLGRLGFAPTDPGEVKIDIGDANPEKMSVTVIWPIPAEPSAAQAGGSDE